MNIKRGFEIELPRRFIPWEIDERELAALLEGDLRHVTHGHYTLTCVSLGGLNHELGFHFAPRHHGRLVELEFFRRSYPDQSLSFHEFQAHFEQTFGKPTSTEVGTCGLPSFQWRLPGAEIVHYVFDRFGPEEHLRIRRSA